MKNDYREIWWKQDESPEEDGASFKYIAQICLFFAGLTLMAIIGFNF